MGNQSIQCPCGQDINKFNQYTLLYLKKDIGEIDILCPNEYCYLRELGYLKIEIIDKKEIKFEKGKFYSPYVTWNATRLTEDHTRNILRSHLIDITEKLVQWDKIIADELTAGEVK